MDSFLKQCPAYRGGLIHSGLVAGGSKFLFRGFRVLISRGLNTQTVLITEAVSSVLIIGVSSFPGLLVHTLCFSTSYIHPSTDSPQYHFDSIPSLRKQLQPPHTTSSNDATPTPDREEQSNNEDMNQPAACTKGPTTCTAPYKISPQKSRKNITHQEQNSELKEEQNTDSIGPQSTDNSLQNHVTIYLTRENSSSTEDMLLTSAMFEVGKLYSISDRPPLSLPTNHQPTNHMDSLVLRSLEDSISPTPVTALREHAGVLRWQKSVKQSKEASLEVSGNYVNEGLGPSTKQTPIL